MNIKTHLLEGVNTYFFFFFEKQKQTKNSDRRPPKEVHGLSFVQVVVLQEYHNKSSTAIEAKYVFPLGDGAAVCGFEAFINDKHIVGQVKEKEVAHKEYKKAVSEGHGAYLMDQDEETPVSVCMCVCVCVCV